MADLQHLVVTSATPAAVYPLIARGTGFAQWWAADVWGGTDPPDTVALGFFSRQTVYQLRIASHAPRKKIVWKCETGREWADTTLEFELEKRTRSTLVHLTHRGWREETEYFRQCNTTWGELLFRLKAAAEGGKPGPLFTLDGLAT